MADDSGPITLGEIRRYRAMHERLERHREDITVLNEAILRLARHTGYGTRKAATDGDDDVSTPVSEP